MSKIEESLFEFITDDQLRDSLVSDANELSQAFECGSWKAVHVLSGSIVESVLLEHIVSEGLKDKASALKLELWDMIEICKDAKIIKDRTVNLSSVIRRHRNLIHPGRLLRLEEQEEISRESASVAIAVVTMIAREVSSSRTAKHGPTAKQIVHKIENDPAAAVIAGHLISEVRESEVIKLLTKLLPDAYSRWAGLEQGSDVCRALVSAFHLIFDKTSEVVKREAAAWIAAEFRRSGKSELESGGLAFVLGSHIEWMPTTDSQMVKDYLISRMRPVPTRLTLDSLKGVGKVLTAADAHDLIDPIMFALRSNKRIRAEEFLQDELGTIPPREQDAFRDRLYTWAKHFETEEHRSDLKQIAHNCIGCFEVPF